MNSVTCQQYRTTNDDGDDRKSHAHIFGFPVFSSLPVPSVPRSSFVGSLWLVSAFKLTGSPNWLGFVSILSCAICLRLLPCWSALLGALFGLSTSVGWLSDVSALRLTGSPSWDGFAEFFSRAICFSDLSSCLWCELV